jgi:hypothetical protein
MARPPFFALTDSDLNRFLLAPIGEELSGMTLSVFSGFARLDLDPWDEAERLAGLPAWKATEALASAIGRMSGCWLPAEARRIAERLVPLLPHARSAPVRATPVSRQSQVQAWLIWLLVAALVVAATLNFVS